MSYLNNFPLPEYRKYQKEAILEVEKAFSQGYKYVLLNAPVGFGKSVLNYTIAKSFEKSYIVTTQKLLQEQYSSEFSEIFSMKGRSNYSCRFPEYENCSRGKCSDKSEDSDSIKEVCYSQNLCKYNISKSQAIQSQITIMNFAYFLLETNYVGMFGKRDLLIIDEAHNSEMAIMSMVELNISEFILNKRLGINVKLPKTKQVKDYVHPISLIQEKLKAHTNINDKDLEELVDNYRRKITFFLNNYSSFVCSYTENDNGLSTHTFKPLKIDKYADELLFKSGEKILMTSGTLLSKKVICDSLGINMQDAYYINVPSAFPVENHPIYKCNVGKMDYNSIKKTLPSIVETIDKILDKHKDEKGLIHTNSYNVTRYIEDNCKSKRIITHESNNREEMFEKFLNSKDLVMMSPSMREGINLSDDLSRFQIVCKLPYPSLGDEQIKARMECDGDWYKWLVALNLVQMCGRSVRSIDDHAITYILDSGFSYFISQNQELFPEYFLKSISKAEIF